MSGPFKMRGISPLSKKTKTSSKKSDAPKKQKKKKYTTKDDMIVLNDGTGRIGLHKTDQ